MAILVDRPIWPFDKRLWSHLVSDSSFDELHEFASRLGVPRKAFQGDHYDIPAELFGQAIRLGAKLVDPRDLVGSLKRAGLRLPPKLRRGTGQGEVSRPED